MKKILIVLSIAVATVVSGYAQTPVTTGPVNTTMKVAWELPSNIPLSATTTVEFRFYDSLVPATFTLLQNVQCILVGVDVSCTSPLSQANVDALNKMGAHTLTLSVFRADVGESAQSLPFTLLSPPAAPINPRIIR